MILLNLFHFNIRHPERNVSHNLSSSSKLSPSINVSSKLQTPLDLELDLAAQQSKLKILQDEIDRLKTIKSKMEEAKQKGNKEIPEWLQEDEPFQELLNKVNCFLNLIRYL